MIRRVLIGTLLLAFACGARADGIYNIGAGGIYDTTFGALIGAQGGLGPPPTPCSPGVTNGHMDFSFCSNVGITAALP